MQKQQGPVQAEIGSDGYEVELKGELRCFLYYCFFLYCFNFIES